MVAKETVLSCSDNSGIVYAKCINLSSAYNKNTFNLSNIITIVPKIIDFSKPLRKKKYLGLVIGVSKLTRRRQGIWIKFNSNRVLLLNDNLKFLGTRVYGPLCREVRTSRLRSSLKKIISYSKMSI